MCHFKISQCNSGSVKLYLFCILCYKAQIILSIVSNYKCICSDNLSDIMTRCNAIDTLKMLLKNLIYSWKLNHHCRYVSGIYNISIYKYIFCWRYLVGQYRCFIIAVILSQYTSISHIFEDDWDYFVMQVIILDYRGYISHTLYLAAVIWSSTLFTPSFLYTSCLILSPNP
jgi:hypothetical protein